MAKNSYKLFQIIDLNSGTKFIVGITNIHAETYSTSKICYKIAVVSIIKVTTAALSDAGYTTSKDRICISGECSG